MWRRPEQPKTSSPDAEAAVGSGVETSLPAPASPSHPLEHAPVAGSHSPTHSHLTSALTIKGEITGKEDLLIDAKLDGLVLLEGATVTIGPHGRVTADIEAGEIVVHGGVTGGLQGHERVRIGSTGRASGQIVSRRISIEGGAEIHGRVEVTRVAESAAPRAGAAASAQVQVAVPHAVQSGQPATKEPSAAA
jgi:cytoskeletal protein CcmA (bactofilin family)